MLSGDRSLASSLLFLGGFFYTSKFKDLFHVLIYFAGVWSLFHAVIYRSFLPCPFAPQLFNTPQSLDSTPPCVSGKISSILFTVLLVYTSLLMLMNWSMLSRCWKTCWKILCHISSTVIRNIEFGKPILCFYLLDAYVLG